MRYGIPLLGDRVAPRCTIADKLLVVTLAKSQIRSRLLHEVETPNWDDLVVLLGRVQIDTLICGGITKESKDEIINRDINVVDNVAGTANSVVTALISGTLRPGLGLQVDSASTGDGENRHTELQEAQGMRTASAPHDDFSQWDCLVCRDRACLQGQPCPLSEGVQFDDFSREERKVVDAAMDVAFEVDRTLCRLSELIYFCLDTECRRVGLAFCTELLEPTEILASVLRRFFDVIPVCCKIGGMSLDAPNMRLTRSKVAGNSQNIICNPIGQADLLNQAETDMNIVVGLCLGIDTLFVKHSQAPVSTLFVKDKSLANNPIGALYSDYYLKEAARSAISINDSG